MAFQLKKRPKQGDAAPKKPKKPSKKKAFKASKGTKFVLFIGDEGAILVYLKDNVVERRQFVPDTSPQSLEEISSSFAQDLKAPVLLAIDTMDQSYVQQTLPPVSSMSVNKMIKRRLERDFGNNELKTSVVLGREKSGRKDWSFLMIAVEKTPAISAWVDFVAELPNRFAGIFLVAVEAESLVKYLEREIQTEEGKIEWKFLVAHNKVGGFRQVILRNNRIVFTRLAQPIGDSSPEVIAGNIEQEVLSTIEYMKRMSYTPAAGLDIYIIGATNLKTAINRNKFGASSVNILTPYDVAEILHIEGATQPNDQFADVILAALIGCSKKHIRTLSLPQFNRIIALHKAKIFQRYGGTAAALGMIFYIGSIAFDVYSAYSKKDDLLEQKHHNQKDLDSLREKIKMARLNVDDVSELMDLYWQLMSEQISPLSFIQQLSQAAGTPHVHIKEFDWTLEAAATPGGAAPPGGMPKPVVGSGTLVPVAPLPNDANVTPPIGNDTMSGVLTLEFSNNENDQKTLSTIAKNALSDFKTIFKGYTVEYDSLPANMRDQETENLNIDLGSSSAPPPPPPPSSNGPTEVKLKISGFVDPVKAAATPPKKPGIKTP